MTDNDVPILVERIAGLDRFMTAALTAQDEKVQLALTSAEKAITKAETATEKRFEAVNEFRQTLSDQAATFATKEKVDDLSAQVSRLLISLLITIVGVLIGALVLVATRQ
jgi:hypothetical protein